MPSIKGMLMTIKPDDKIEGSSQLARAVWALGRLGKPSYPAEIARIIRARTPLNWEGPQAAKFLRGFKTKHVDWFTRHHASAGGPGRPRYLYDLTEKGRAYFQKRWVEGDWKPRGSNDVRLGRLTTLVKHIAPFRHKDINNPDRVLEKLRVENLALKEECGIMRELLNRIHSCHGEVEKVMSDIDTYLGGVNLPGR